ncbi:MAG: hypothetical protein H5T65_04475 [Chloroflexi bacterium]|nr:hypothetical protein [Chloroflexota bacterium]
MEHKHIPGLGQVKLRPITFGAVIKAYELAEDAQAAQAADVFANSVLSSMLHEPHTTPEDIDRLPTESLSVLIEWAVEYLQIRDHFNETPADLPIRERFFRALSAHEKEMTEQLKDTVDRQVQTFKASWESLAASLRSMEPMAPLREQIVAALSKPVVPLATVGYLSLSTAALIASQDIIEKLVGLAESALVTQEALSKQIQDLTREFDARTRRTFADLAAVAIAFQQTIPLIISRNLLSWLESNRDAAEAFNAAGWPIAPSMPIALRDQVARLHRNGKTRYVSRTIIAYYHRSKYEKLTEAVESWEDHPLFASRMHILRDALAAHRQRKYTLSVPTLLPQIEGVLNDYVTANQLVARIGKIEEVYRAAVGDPDAYDLARWAIATTVLYQLQTSTYVFTDFKRELKKSACRRQVTRHTVLHGIAVRYDRPVHSLKAFLLLDALSALQEYN